MRANLEAVYQLRRPTSWRIARCCIVRRSMVRLPFPPIRRYRDDSFPSLSPPALWRSSLVVEKDYLYRYGYSYSFTFVRRGQSIVVRSRCRFIFQPHCSSSSSSSSSSCRDLSRTDPCPSSRGPDGRTYRPNPSISATLSQSPSSSSSSSSSFSSSLVISLDPSIVHGFICIYLFLGFATMKQKKIRR